MRVIIRGAGDIATGIAVRLHAAGFAVIMLECAVPTCIRRSVAFSEAVRLGTTCVEGLRAELASDAQDALRKATPDGPVAVLVDPEGSSVAQLHPDALVDAILAKRNMGTTVQMAPIVVGVGPGFTAGLDCHAAVETMRGHYLGRVLYQGSPLADTGIPGDIGGYTAERVMRAPVAGKFVSTMRIGSVVNTGDVVAHVSGAPVTTAIGGVLRGILQDGVDVPAGMKVADVDPRCVPKHCESVSDKARSVGGGVLEAIMHFSVVK